jgi:integrase
MHTLSAEEARRLLAAATGDRLEAVYALALATGMRQGELLGLHRRNVDLETGVIQVRESVGRVVGHGFVFAETKTGKARRVDITTAAIDALRQHRRRQNQERLRLGPTWADLDLVFANELGNPIEHGNLLRRSFAPLLERAGLPHIRFHELRHTAVSLLLAAGVPVHIVSRMVGHSQIAITVDTYAHVTPNDLGQAVDAMERLLKTPLSLQEVDSAGTSS